MAIIDDQQLAGPTALVEAMGVPAQPANHGHVWMFWVFIDLRSNEIWTD